MPPTPSATEATSPSVLETIYKEILFNPLTELNQALKTGLVGDKDTNPIPLLNQISKALFNPSLPIGQAIQGDAYIIEQLPEYIAMNPKNRAIAALMFAEDFFKTNEAKALINNETQCQGAVDLISNVLTGIKDEPGIFDKVESVMSKIQESLDGAREGNYLHLETKDKVVAQLAQLQG